MATHSSVLAWRIPWREDPGRLQSIGLQSWTGLKQLSTAQHMCVYTHTHTHTHVSISILLYICVCVCA